MKGFIAGKGVVWDEILKVPGIRRAKKAAIAYYSSASRLPLKRNDLLIVDASEEAIADGRTSARELEKAFVKKVRIHHCPKLHAKMIVLASGYAIVGSMNGSSRSATTLVEAAIITEDADTVDAAEKWIDELSEVAPRLDEREIERLLDVKVEAKEDGERGRKKGAELQMEVPQSRFKSEPKTVYTQVFIRERMRGPDVEDADQELDAMIEEIDPSYEANWFRMPSPTKALRALKPGDDLFLGRIEKGGEIMVLPRCQVYRSRGSRKTGSQIVHYWYPSRDKEIPFEEFRKRMNSFGVVVRPKSAGKAIPADIATIVRKRWPGRGRRKQA